MTIKTSAWGLFLSFLVSCGTAQAQESKTSPVGLYRAQEGPDVASHLLLDKEGHFAFELMAGALDLWAKGDWKQEEDGSLSLTTLPRPRPPELQIRHMETHKGQAFTLHVAFPNGQGVPGVDFRLGLANGEVIEDYTQKDGWERDFPRASKPVWIEMREPIYRASLPRTDIPVDVNDVELELVPNDMGVMDFDGASAILDREKLVIHTTEGSIRFVRIHETP